MGKVISGAGMGFSGKVGNLVYSQHRDGTTRVRSVPVASGKPMTVGQLSTAQDTTICALFMKPLADFVRVGYDCSANALRKSAYHVMVSHLRKETIKGVYPNREIDFSKVLMSKGDLQPPRDAAVKRTAAGLEFSWNSETSSRNHYTDQVVMLAYFPELAKCVFITAGAQRDKGKDELFLRGTENGYVAEIYLSFVTNDRRRISDSVYLGQLNW